MRNPISRLLAVVPVVGLLVAAWAVPAFADPRDFNVANNSSIVLTHVYVSPSDVQQWGDDILGRDVLNPTESVSVSFGGFDGNSCLYDLKVVGQQGEQGLMYKVDLCSTTTVTFSDAT
jgi:hypothetical protein